MGKFDKVLTKLENGDITAAEALAIIENAKVKVVKGKAHWINIRIVADDFKMPFPIKLPLFLANFGLWIAKIASKEAREELTHVDTKSVMKVVRQEMKGVDLVDVVSRDAIVKISFT